MTKYIRLPAFKLMASAVEMSSLIERDGVLEVSLIQNNGEEIKLFFESYLCYRKMDEGDAMLALADVAASNVVGEGMLQVEESEFLSWFEAQAHQIWRGRGVIHYAIHTANDIVDVLSLAPPICSSGQIQGQN